MSALMSRDDIYHFENFIYLPMVLTILLKDRERIEKGDFKLPGPYLQLIDQAVKTVEKDLRETNAYIRERKYKVLKIEEDDLFIVYEFHFRGYEEKRKYLKVRLRNRTEELLAMYLQMQGDL
ncbi:hypothetical protein [Planomicrobium sp. MB-3u-38]|uniref:hypothetical protein n=1 Tax=Planomicrobium sp. MB-3u-38 TaxID=2058318 RepID=UPI000C7E519C|nr:hypothetical protein [Planomicrobium sp. MB-3u-38]PKH09876.1 hypothetical protein CXF70_11740 [Planomicrobium sp. MB-3u-38]